MVAIFLLVLAFFANAETQPTAKQQLQNILAKLKLTENEQKALDAAEREHDRLFQACLDEECITMQDAIIELQRQGAKVEQFDQLGKKYTKCLETCQKKDKDILRQVEKLQERSEVYNELLELQNTGEIEAALEYWGRISADLDM